MNVFIALTVYIYDKAEVKISLTTQMITHPKFGIYEACDTLWYLSDV